MKITKEQRKELNALLHKLVRLRDGEHCLRCPKTARLQLSHIYPKGKKRGMEFEPDNVKLLCVGCHLYWWHKNPMEAMEWLKTVIPTARLDRLKLMSQTTNKIDFNLQKIFIEKEIERLTEREDTVHPRLSSPGSDPPEHGRNAPYPNKCRRVKSAG